MYVSWYLHMYVYTLVCIYAIMYICVYASIIDFVYMQVYVCVHLCKYACGCMYADYVSMHVNKCLWVQLCMYESMHSCNYLFMYVCIYVCVGIFDSCTTISPASETLSLKAPSKSVKSFLLTAYYLHTRTHTHRLSLAYKSSPSNLTFERLASLRS